MKKLTKDQAVVVSGYTGFLACKFSDLHADVERRLGRPVINIEFGTKEFASKLEEIYRADFLGLLPDKGEE